MPVRGLVQPPRPGKAGLQWGDGVELREQGLRRLEGHLDGLGCCRDVGVWRTEGSGGSTTCGAASY